MPPTSGPFAAWSNPIDAAPLNHKVEKIPPRPLSLSFVLACTTVLAGLTIRFAHLGLPQSVTKYGGSTLWAVMIYWLVSTLLPRRAPLTAAVLASILGTSVEFLKLYHNPALDAFRLTLPGILLLGRFFSPWDIAAYCVAILGGALADTILRLRPLLAQPPLNHSSRP